MKTTFSSESAYGFLSASMLAVSTLVGVGNPQTFAQIRSLPGTSDSALENLNNPSNHFRPLGSSKDGPIVGDCLFARSGNK